MLVPVSARSGGLRAHDNPSASVLRTGGMHAPADLDYCSLFRSLPGIHLVLSPDLVILEASDGALEATMTRREDVVGRPLFEVFPDAAGATGATGMHNLRRSLERVRKERVPDVMAVQKHDLPRRSEAGGGIEERYWRSVNTPVLGPDGEVRFLLHRADDVTELVKASQARSRVVTVAGRVARVGGWTLDVARRTVHWSDEVCALHDAPPGTTLTLEEGYEAYLPEWRSVIAAHVRACMEEGTPYDLELEKLTFTGRRIWVRTIGEAVRAEDGTVTHIQGAFQDITAQRQAHERQLDSERRYRQLFENSMDGILQTAPDGRTLAANPAACRLLGYEKEEILAIGRDGLVDVTDARVRAIIEQRTRTGQGFGEISMRRKDGTWLPVELTTQAFHGAGGELYASILFRDISERKRAEAALLESEEKLRQIAENIREIFWMSSPDFSEAIYVSPAYEAIFGQSVESLYEDGRAFLAAVHREDRDALLNAMRAVREGKFHGVEYRVLRPDGEVRWVRSAGYPIRDEAGQVYRLVGTTEDITDRKRAEAERAVAEADYRHLFETAPYGIYALDAEGCFTKLNPAAERAAGRCASELIGKHFSTVIAPVDLPVAEDAFNRVISGQANDIEFDERILRPSGEERLLRVTESAIRDGDRIVGTHGIARDITEEMAQQKLLRRAERLASVGTLLGGVAHELNNPLHAIRNFAELMLMEPRSADDREMLEIVQREADRAAKVVSDLRLIARDTQGSAAERNHVDVNDIVRHVVKIRDYSWTTHNVELSLELAEDLPLVLANRGEIEQVVLNLVVNAEQALNDRWSGARRLLLRTRRTPEGASIHVVDSGPGIAPQHLDRIFDPFFTTKAPGEGTGLGLSLVHNIVTEHRGRIHVESEPGQGAAFRVDLPRAPARHEARADPRRGGNASSGLRVLVADDEPAIRRVTQRYLQRQGHLVDVVIEGGEALRLLARAEYDVIVSDLRMPGIGGEELLHRLREQGQGLEQRLIFVTGDAANVQSARVIDEAGVPVLVKPIRLEELARVVEQVGARTRGAKDGRPSGG